MTKQFLLRTNVVKIKLINIYRHQIVNQFHFALKPRCLSWQSHACFEIRSVILMLVRLFLLAGKAIAFESHCVGIFMFILKFWFLYLRKAWVADEVLILADFIIHELFVSSNAFIWDQNACDFGPFYNFLELLLSLAWGLHHRKLIWTWLAIRCVQVHAEHWRLTGRSSFLSMWGAWSDVLWRQQVQQLWLWRSNRRHEVLGCVIESTVAIVDRAILLAVYGGLSFLVVDWGFEPVFVALMLVLQGLRQELRYAAVLISIGPWQLRIPQVWASELRLLHANSLLEVSFILDAISLTKCSSIVRGDAELLGIKVWKRLVLRLLRWIYVIIAIDLIKDHPQVAILVLFRPCISVDLRGFGLNRCLLLLRRIRLHPRVIPRLQRLIDLRQHARSKLILWFRRRLIGVHMGISLFNACQVFVKLHCLMLILL